MLSANSAVQLRSFARRVPFGERKQSDVQLITNAHGVIPQSPLTVYKYDVHVYMEFENGFRREVSKPTKDDTRTIERKNICTSAFRYVVGHYKNFFGDKDGYVYDRSSILYTIDELAVARDEKAEFDVPLAEIQGAIISEDCKNVVFEVQSCLTSFVLKLKGVNGDAADEDEVEDDTNESVRQFLSLLVSQAAFFDEGRFISYDDNATYLFDPAKHGFTASDLPSIPGGAFIGVGASKTTRVMEGPRGPGYCGIGLCVDVKKSAFHLENQGVMDKIAALLGVPVNQLVRTNTPDFQRIVPSIKGLLMRTTYGTRRVIRCDGLTREGPTHIKFNVRNRDITISDYFLDCYGMNLVPSLPMVCDKSSPKGTAYYPIDHLVVCENQRVTFTQQTSNQVQAMIRACAIAPTRRVTQTENVFNALALGNRGQQNAWCTKFNVKLTRRALQLAGRVLPTPKIEYARNASAPITAPMMSWQANRLQYVQPVTVKKWWAAGLFANNERLTADGFRSYLEAFVRCCTNHGIRIGMPSESEVIRSPTQERLEQVMGLAGHGGVQYFHFVTSDALKHHDFIKYQESQVQVVTQEVRAGTAANAPSRQQTMDNIVNKMNLKLGGVNFKIILENPTINKWLNSRSRLVIGIDASLPMRVSSAEMDDKTFNRTPAVIGFSSNCKGEAVEFVGGFQYAQYTRGMVSGDGFVAVFSEALTSFRDAHKGQSGVEGMPTSIVVYRDGVPDGQQANALAEVDFLRDACTNVEPNYDPLITYVVCTKRHNTRFYSKDAKESDKPSAQNIRSGTVVETGIVNPDRKEFYLNAHCAFQGTAQTPLYTVIHDSAELQADELQGLTYALCFGHAIVNQAVSIPAPLLIAKRMASRGRTMFNGKHGSEGHDVPDITALNVNLSYSGKPLSDVRFNA